MSAGSWSVGAVALAAVSGWLLPDARAQRALGRLVRRAGPSPPGDGSGSQPRFAAGARIRRRARPAARAAARRAVVGELLDGLVAELRAGADPAAAVGAAAGGLPGLDAVARAAAAPSGDVAAALAEVGGATATDLAATWRVAERTGCALAAPVERLLEVHRDGERLRGELAAQLAGPVATGRLLAALPLAGVAMGTALGADPVGFLTGSTAGLVCLGLGSALLVLGMRWTRSVAAAVTTDWTGDDP